MFPVNLAPPKYASLKYAFLVNFVFLKSASLVNSAFPKYAFPENFVPPKYSSPKYAFPVNFVCLKSAYKVNFEYLKYAY